MNATQHNKETLSNQQYSERYKNGNTEIAVGGKRSNKRLETQIHIAENAINRMEVAMIVNGE